MDPHLPKLIGLHGAARAGKDTVAALLVAVGYQRFGFADNLRNTLLALDPLIVDVRAKQLIADIGWEGAKDSEVYGPEVRRLLQNMGTEVGREFFGVDVWVDMVGRQIDKAGAHHVVVSDVRFPSEAEWVHERGGVVWQVNRPGFGGINGHASEQVLDVSLVEAHLDNDDTLDELALRVNSTLLSAGLLFTVGSAPITV